MLDFFNAWAHSSQSIWNYILLHQATWTVGMKQMRRLDHCLCLSFTCCYQKPWSVASVFRSSQSCFCVWQCWDVFLNSRTMHWDEWFQTHSNCRFGSCSQIQRFLKKGRKTWEKINSNEGTGRKMHSRASSMETRENIWKIDQWENLISSPSCQSSFYTEMIFTHVFP